MIVDKLKILYISHSAGLDGAEKCLYNLIKHLDRTKFIPIVALPDKGPLKRELDKIGVKTVVLPLMRWILFPWDAGIRDNEGLSERCERISSLIKAEGIDIVHTNTSVIIEGAIAARMTGKPHVWHLHEILKGHPRLKPLFPLDVTNRFIGLLSDSVVTVSEALKKSVSDDIDPERTKVIYNSIELDGQTGEKKPLREELGIPEDGFLVLTVGSIIKEKGHHTFIDAAKNVLASRKDVWFISAGELSDHELMSSLREKISAASIDRYIKFLGFRKDICRILKEIDIYVVSSQTESFGLAVAEAMAAGKPVIATRCGGPEEIVIDRETGLLVPLNDASALSDAIFSLLCNPEKRIQMGAKGIKRCEMLFTADRYCEAFEKLYLGLEKKVLSPADERHLDSLINLLIHMQGMMAWQSTEKDRYIDALFNSYSWRIAAPLRSLRGFLKKYRV